VVGVCVWWNVWCGMCVESECVLGVVFLLCVCDVRVVWLWCMCMCVVGVCVCGVSEVGVCGVGVCVVVCVLCV